MKVEDLVWVKREYVEHEWWFYLDDGKVLVVGRYYMSLYVDKLAAIADDPIWELDM